VIPSTFTYKRAGSAEEALDLVAEHGEDAKFLAGGHSLLPLMKLRLAAPEVLIDLGGLSDLSYITDQGSYVAMLGDEVQRLFGRPGPFVGER
jgi:carbon-monoxide dehydrogenase medium subunit